MSELPNTDPGPKPRMALWLKLLLAASVAINMLVIGVIAGAWLSPQGPRGAKVEQAGRDIGGAPFIRALEPADRRSVMAAMRREGEALRMNRDELRLRFEALLGALRAEVFDPSEVSSLLQLQRSAAIQRQEIGERILVERLSEMSVDDRRAFADRLERSLRRGPDRKSRDDD